MSRRPKPKVRTETSVALSEFIAGRGTTQYGLSRVSPVAQPYLNQVINSSRIPSGSWIDVVADSLDLDDAERVKLHRAAATDNGYKIDLIKK